MRLEVEELELEAVVSLLELCAYFRSLLLGRRGARERLQVCFYRLDSTKVGRHLHAPVSFRNYTRTGTRLVGVGLELLYARLQRGGRDFIFFYELVGGETGGDAEAGEEADDAAPEAADGALDGGGSDVLEESVCCVERAS